MAGTIVGSGKYTYEVDKDWGKLPDGWSYREAVGAAVDAHDNVFVFTRGEHPVIVFDRQGNFLRSWGEGVFSNRPHGIIIGPDGLVYTTDDGDHTVRKFTPEGKLLMTIGTPNQPAPRFSGRPFNRPTHIAISPRTGDLYISDGYGNARVHKYDPSGRLLFSWGESGTDPGQFFLPHNLVTDADDRVYVADREVHRIQIFDAKGKLLGVWNNFHRPCGLFLGRGPDPVMYVGELCPPPGYKDAQSLGHCIKVLDLNGQQLCRFGDPMEGEGPSQFIGPHGLCVDSRGDLYVAEVSYTVRGQFEKPPRELPTFRKLIRRG